MVRYCQVCQKEYDFPVKSMKELGELFCPECGNPILANSRKPVVESVSEKPANAIGSAYAGMIRFFYLFFFLCIGLGLFFYALHLQVPLVIVTIVTVLFGMLRYGNFGLCSLFLLGGALLGFLFGKSVQNVCLGVMIGTALFCLVRGFIYWVIGALIRAGR